MPMKKSWNYPHEVYQLTEITFDVARYLEGYAQALDHILHQLTGEGFSCKSYDPLTVEGNKLHSYAFEFRDGGRHHDATLYDTVGEIVDDMLKETVEYIKQDISPYRT